VGLLRGHRPQRRSNSPQSDLRQSRIRVPHPDEDLDGPRRRFDLPGHERPGGRVGSQAGEVDHVLNHLRRSEIPNLAMVLTYLFCFVVVNIKGNIMIPILFF